MRSKNGLHAPTMGYFEMKVNSKSKIAILKCKFELIVIHFKIGLFSKSLVEFQNEFLHYIEATLNTIHFIYIYKMNN